MNTLGYNDFMGLASSFEEQCRNDLEDLVRLYRLDVSIEEVLNLSVVYIVKTPDLAFRLLGEVKSYKEVAPKEPSDSEMKQKKVYYKTVQLFNFSKRKMEKRKNIEIRATYKDFYRFVNVFTQLKLLEKIKESEVKMHSDDHWIESTFQD